MNEKEKSDLKIIGNHVNEYSDGIRLVLNNGEQLAQLIEKAQNLSFELSQVTHQIQEFTPTWQLESLTQD